VKGEKVMQKKKEKLKLYITNNLDKLYRLAFSYAKNEHDAEDIVNESVKRALDAIYQLEKEEFLGTWMYRIVINTASSYMKMKSKLIYIDEIIENTLVKEDTYQDTDLYNMVMKLDSQYRIVIVLRFYEDMAIDKMAEVLNENVSTVKTRLYKALKLLKIEMNEEALIDERKYFQGS
jgi:RNA polymerase sigma-70 factor, ECF subfamily